MDKLEKKFWENVEKTKSCWIWRGPKLKSGYGTISSGSMSPILTHRYSYQLHKGEIPKGIFICHSCDNPPCVNPKHLWAGTHTENMQDAKKKGRIATGDRHGTRTHPETIRYGKDNPNGRLSIEDKNEIYKLYKVIPAREIAIKYKISILYVYELWCTERAHRAQFLAKW